MHNVQALATFQKHHIFHFRVSPSVRLLIAETFSLEQVTVVVDTTQVIEKHEACYWLRQMSKTFVTLIYLEPRLVWTKTSSSRIQKRSYPDQQYEILPREPQRSCSHVIH